MRGGVGRTGAWGDIFAAPPTRIPVHPLTYIDVTDVVVSGHVQSRIKSILPSWPFCVLLPPCRPIAIEGESDQERGWLNFLRNLAM